MCLCARIQCSRHQTTFVVVLICLFVVGGVFLFCCFFSFLSLSLSLSLSAGGGGWGGDRVFL